MSSRVRSFIGVAIASVSLFASGCGGDGRASASRGAGGETSASSNATTTSSGDATGSGTGGGGGQTIHGAALELPPFLNLPYVVAGAGPSHLEVAVANAGDVDVTGPDGGAIVWELSGDASLTLATSPSIVPHGGSAKLALDFAGAPAEAILTASLVAHASDGDHRAIVFGVAGDPGLGAAAFENLIGPGGVVCGVSATVSMPTAPFPDGGGEWTDPSVAVFVPDGYRERGEQDLVLHFHGFGGILEDTLTAHLYREQLYASGANAVLVVPQGPVDADSGDFGKLMRPGGVTALMRETLVVLYREGKIEAPLLGALALTSHSGGYEAVATNLSADAMAPPVSQVDLFDSMYGYESTFEDFVTAGGTLRSDYSSDGGTLTLNEDYARALEANGTVVGEAMTQTALRGDPAVVFFADSSHDGTTRVDCAYGEELRWRLPHSRRGPRVELRTAIASGGQATVTWLAPSDEDLQGFAVQTSNDGTTWKTVRQADPKATSATFALSGGARVRLLPIMKGVDDALPSDVYRVDAGAKVLVIDGFDRILDGAFGGLSHDFSAIVGEAVGPVATIAHRALTEDAFDPSGFDAIVWLLGDESVDDHAMSAAEQTIAASYVDGGGHLLVSGSELGYTLAMSSDGEAFLASMFGASFAADASGSYSAIGAAASSPSFTYSGKSAPYDVKYPDAFTATGQGAVALAYGNGMGAAVGISGRAAVVGFPLELVDDDASRKAVVAGLLTFVRQK